MTKTKGARSVYRCTECGHVQNKWGGQCPGCGVWNTLVESVEDPAPGRRHLGYAGEDARSEPVSLAAVEGESLDRQDIGFSELDRVLGGGLVRGSTVLLGGDPGIGKSTLLLQTAAALGARCKTLYITGEESLGQVSLRARRLQLDCENVLILAETALERIVDTARRHAPEILVVDSIQTVYSEALQSAPGSVAQVRECAAHLVRYAKRLQCSVFLIGHVTKEGALAGPRVLEHMVDTVLYFEGDSNSRFRVVRSFKNRFGAVNELGVFAMTEHGLREVRNPSAIFLSRYDEDLPGSVVMVMREGSRPILLEVQALVDDCRTGMPRRVAVGMENNRLAMLLAVLHRHGGMPVMDQDVFVNLVGGLRLSETAGDLPVLMAIASSYRDRPVPRDWVVFGEVGLNGEVRPVANGEERLREAVKQGFRHALVPALNAPRAVPGGMEVTAVRTLREALAIL
ncbi:MAG: DNA repair protein RadA [Gammaproteobacteria bacterium]|nr:DNA repair protein RadA [Gammaproteobacteria bacterium]